MFLRNYYNLMARYNINMTNNLSGEEYGNSSLRIRNCKGGFIDSFNLNHIDDNILISLTNKDISTSTDIGGILFGTGNEPVTFNDYKLGTQIVSGITSTRVSISNITYDVSLNKFNCSSKYTLSNTSNENIIIREYGISLYYYDGHDFYQFLIFRDLIEPYTLQPSESVNIILNASYTMSTIDESGTVVAGTQAYSLAIE